MRVEPVLNDDLVASILATIPVGILVVDPVSQRIVSANAHARHVLDPEWQERDLIGLELAEVFTMAREELRQLIPRIAASGEHIHLANTPYAGFARGMTYWDVDIMPVHDADGACTAIIYSYSETTANVLAQRDLAETNRELATLSALGATVAESLDFDAVIERVFVSITALIPHDRAFLMLEDDAEHLRIVAARGKDPMDTRQVGMTVPKENSVNGWVFTRRRSHLAADVQAPGNDVVSYQPPNRDRRIRAALCVPLIAREQAIGTIYLAKFEPDIYSDRDLARLEMFAAQAAAALANARLYTESRAQVAEQQRLNAELETLREVGIAVTSTLDLNDLLRRVLSEIGRVVPYEQGAINLVMPGRDTLRVEVAVGTAMEQLAGTEISMTASLNGYAFRAGQTVCVDDFWTSEWLTRSHRFDVGPDALRSILCAPLQIGGERIGTLYLAHSQPARYHSDDIVRIERYASQVAVAVANARLYARVRQQVDELQAVNTDLQTMHDLGLAISASLDLEVVLPRALDEIRRIIRAEAGYVVLTEPDGETLRIAAAFGFMADRVGARFPIEGSINGAIIRSGETLLLHDQLTDPAWAGREHRPSAPIAANNLRSILGVPLAVAGAVIGTVYLVHREASVFTPHDAARLERYAAPMAIAVANARLYEQIQLQVAELRRLNDDLAQANRHKSEFLATMSHELRTPLNAIIGFSELLADDIVTEPEERQQSLRDIHTSATHLLSLINDVLDVAKIESGKMEMRPVALDMRAELAEAERIMAPLIAARQQSLSVSVSPDTPPAFADRARFRQVLLNVLSNANKFTPDGGSIAVTCEWARGTREAGRSEQRAEHSALMPPKGHPQHPALDFVRVRVTDTGIGIRPEDAHKVFEEFRQIDASLNRQYGGTGLGLALSKRLIEMQGGTIAFESMPGVGTTFSVTVPRAASGIREVGKSGRAG